MGTVESDERALWAESLLGNGDAFGKLFDRYRERVFRHAYRLTADRHDAEDVLAAAFLELWRKRHRVRIVDGSVLPWLLVTASNAARNTARSTARYRKLLASIERTPEPAESSESAYLQKTISGDAAKALGTLGKVDLQLVSLVIFEGYSVVAAAGILKMTPGTAKVRMHRARQRMKSAITGPVDAKSIPALEGGKR
jgi:RNA polymerase sigma-70 factor (ECF subfamily)